MKRIIMLVLLLAIGACRDGAAPFSLPESTTEDSALVQFTFGRGQDRDPSWTGPDSLLYHTSWSDALPNATGALVQIGVAGGPATPLFPDVQQLRLNLATPVRSPTGDRVAYIDIFPTLTHFQCSGNPNDISFHCNWNQPLLDSAVLRVRRIGETRPFTQDPSIGFKLHGTGIAPDGAMQRVYPFQWHHRYDHEVLFRPSWSPDGQRIAYSDGLRVRIWQVGSAEATTLPGSADGVTPAWSPDGSRIAFTSHIRGDSVLINCTCNAAGNLFIQPRWVYTVSERVLVVMRADGSERVELGEGQAPAWSPDGRSIYVQRRSAIARVTFPGGVATELAGTSFGRAPAVSPDGRWLAFARSKTLPMHPVLFTPTYDWDIWLARLSQ